MDITLNEFIPGYWESSAEHPVVGTVTGLGPSEGKAWGMCAESYRDANQNPHHFIGCNFPCRCPKTHGELKLDAADAEYGLCFAGFGRRVWVAHDVVEVWQSHRQAGSSAPEAHGVLLAETSTDQSELWIESVTTPMIQDVQSRYHFSMMDPGHQRAADAEFQASGGARIYLGTWHTHPEARPRPSGVDEADWRMCQLRNVGSPLLFAIVGIKETRIFVAWKDGFAPLVPVGRADLY